ncbi:MAG: TraR/DksA C4-type zinc finger protein [Planctomycetes bacterium]|nr:TraR/DksA C4-type zinc finger protein [Planctomycetota bacterium]
MLPHKDLESFKKKLLITRSKLASDAEHLENDVHASNGSDGLSLNHLADAGSDTFEVDFSMEQLENKENLLYDIDQALQKIDDGKFGVCDTCSKKISKARLDAIPFASNCVSCQEESEVI